MKMSHFNKGFTLVELLVVISIIGVLAGLLLTNFAGIRGRAADTKRKSDLQQVKRALRLYYNDYQHYPGAGVQKKIHGCGSNGWDLCTTTFSAGTGPNLYMKDLPTELSYYSAGGETFALFVALENASDEDATKSQAACASTITSLSVPVTTGDYVVCED